MASCARRKRKTSGDETWRTRASCPPCCQSRRGRGRGRRLAIVQKLRARRASFHLSAHLVRQAIDYQPDHSVRRRQVGSSGPQRGARGEGRRRAALNDLERAGRLRASSGPALQDQPGMVRAELAEKGRDRPSLARGAQRGRRTIGRSDRRRRVGLGRKAGMRQIPQKHPLEKPDLERPGQAGSMRLGPGLVVRDRGGLGRVDRVPAGEIMAGQVQAGQARDVPMRVRDGAPSRPGTSRAAIGRHINDPRGRGSLQLRVARWSRPRQNWARGGHRICGSSRLNPRRVLRVIRGRARLRLVLSVRKRGEGHRQGRVLIDRAETARALIGREPTGPGQTDLAVTGLIPTGHRRVDLARTGWDLRDQVPSEPRAQGVRREGRRGPAVRHEATADWRGRLPPAAEYRVPAVRGPVTSPASRREGLLVLGRDRVRHPVAARPVRALRESPGGSPNQALAVRVSQPQGARSPVHGRAGNDREEAKPFHSGLGSKRDRNRAIRLRQPCLRMGNLSRFPKTVSRSWHGPAAHP
jgi:hypothetical protein